MSLRSREHVLLRDKGDVVGFAKYVLVGEKSCPSEIIHGHDLKGFAKRRDEKLVAVHSVQIFSEFEDRAYPYRFKSFDDPPATLGDLNNLEKAFKQIIAWDNKVTIDPKPSDRKLGHVPRIVSAKSISPVRDMLTHSPLKALKVSFGTNEDRIVERSLPQAYRASCSSKSMPEPSSRRCQVDVVEFSLEQFVEDEGNEIEPGQASTIDMSMDQFADDDLCDELPYVAIRRPSPKAQVPLLRVNEERSVLQERYRKRQKAMINSEDFDSEGGTFPVRRSQQFPGLSGPLAQAGPNTPSLCPAAEIPLRSNENPSRYTSSSSSVPKQNAITGDSSRATFATIDAGRDDCLVRCVPRIPLTAVNLNVKKRPYTFKTRKRASPKPESNLRRRRNELLQRTVNPFLSPQECCKAECFLVLDPSYCFAQLKRLLQMSRAEKKRALTSMLEPASKRFKFNGSFVCSRFLAKGFLFSNCLQSSVKNTPKARSSSSVLACPREVKSDTKKEDVIHFLRRYAEIAGDNLPTRPFTNLPSMSKKQVYGKYLEVLRENRSTEVPSESYFCRVWKTYCSNIKAHRHHGFTVCDQCEQFRSLMHQYAQDEEKQAKVREVMKEHYDQMAEERRGYKQRKELAKKYPGKYCSIIVDGADQKSYGLPHFIFNTKVERGHKIKVKCVGVLEHSLQKSLSLFTMTEEFESGANHVLEAVHRVLNAKKAKVGTLPEVLFVQADNCTRENKNRYFMAYFEMLVARGVFLEVQVSFLPIGHTHTDIDQSFSSVATRLRMVDAITMDDLLQELRNCYNPCAFAEEMTQMANFSGLCKESKCLNNVENFSQFRYFRFTRKMEERRSQSAKESGQATAQDGEGLAQDGPAASWQPNQNVHDALLCSANQIFPTTCDVKFQEQEEWTPLDTTIRTRGFLKIVPDLRKTPVIETAPPPDVLEINKCLRSCEERIGSAVKSEQLEALRDRVYTRRTEEFSWNVEETFELNGDYRSTGPRTSGNYGRGQDIAGFLGSRLRYHLNFFVALKTDEGPDKFWIARILRYEHCDEEGLPTQLKIRWYQAAAGSEDAFSARYEMATVRRGRKHVLYDDVESVDTVLCEFESLSVTNGLHVRTQKAIRQALNLA